MNNTEEEGKNDGITGKSIKNFKYGSDMTNALFEKAYAEGDEVATKQELQLKVDEEGDD